MPRCISQTFDHNPLSTPPFASAEHFDLLPKARRRLGREVVPLTLCSTPRKCAEIYGLCLRGEMSKMSSSSVLHVNSWMCAMCQNGCMHPAAVVGVQPGFPQHAELPSRGYKRPLFDCEQIEEDLKRRSGAESLDLLRKFQQSHYLTCTPRHVC